jgi:hypothetical protein
LNYQFYLIEREVKYGGTKEATKEEKKRLFLDLQFMGKASQKNENF